jgi:hypothetical protein
MKNILFIILALGSCIKGHAQIAAIGFYSEQNASTTVTLSGRITSDVKLYAKDINFLSGIVYIANGATLTIEAGAKIQGITSGVYNSTLVICRGAKIIATGTAEKPIVFTSSSAIPLSGDWGGIVICGTAPINTSATANGTSILGLYANEGGISNPTNLDGYAGSGDLAFPTSNATDNSGVLQYVRIEYAGYAYRPDNEINSLTLAAVGSGTVIDHVQSIYGKDDAFQFFGGTVNCKYLVSYNTRDEDFEFGLGYIGKIQFAIAKRSNSIADISDSYGIESSNNNSGGTNIPQTKAVLSNFTIIGPRQNSSTTYSSLYNSGIFLRRNTSLSIFNSIVLGWKTGVLIDARTGTPTDNNITDNSLRIKNVTIGSNIDDVKYTPSTSAPTGASDVSILSWFSTVNSLNTIVTNASDASLSSPYATTPDFKPTQTVYNSGTFNGTLGTINDFNFNSNASFTDTYLQDAFFTTTGFRGAVGLTGSDSNWWVGWTVWN